MTAPLRPLPEESTATVPEVSSSFHQPTRSEVRSPSTAEAGPTPGTTPPMDAASASAPIVQDRTAARPHCRVLLSITVSIALAWSIGVVLARLIGRPG